jgi:hypothetical protein
MEKQTYNGWTNYATWRVNLEIFDGLDLMDYGWHRLDEYDLGKALKDHAEELIEQTSDEGLARDYALAFLQDVDWRDIAEHYICDYANDERDDETEEEA